MSEFQTDDDVLESSGVFEAAEVRYGVTVNISKAYDLEKEKEIYQLSFSLDGEEETIVLDNALSIVESESIFKFAHENVPEDHPERLYIAYGRIKRELKRRNDAEKEIEELRMEEKERLLRASLDTSYRESEELSGHRINVLWKDEIGLHGSYVLEFPALEKDYTADDRCNGSGQLETSMIAIGARPEIAKNIFKNFTKNLKKEISEVQDVDAYTLNQYREDVIEQRKLFERYNEGDVFWGQSDEAVNNVFYTEEASVNGVHLSIAYKSFVNQFVLGFPDIIDDPEAENRGIYESWIKLGRNSSTAKERFEYAKELAEKGKDVYEILKSVSPK